MIFPAIKAINDSQLPWRLRGFSHDDTVAKSVRPSVVHQGCGVNDLNGSGQDDHLAGANGFNGCPDWESPDESRGNMLFSGVKISGKQTWKVKISSPHKSSRERYCKLLFSLASFRL